MPIRAKLLRGRRVAALLRWGAAPLVAFLAVALTAQPGSSFDPWWVQNFQETRLWSGTDSRAIPFGSVPQWSYFQVMAPQQGSRLYVLNPATNNYAYIDASAVGPSSPPPSPEVAPSSPPPSPEVAPSSPHPASGAAPKATISARKTPDLPPGFRPLWVSNFVETELWSGPQGGASSLGAVPQFRRFLVMEPQNGDRLRVWSPEKEVFGYLDASALGPTGPSVWMEAHPVRFVRQIELPGRSIGNRSYVRNLPVHDDETELRWAPNNTALDVRDKVATPDGTEWYTVAGGGYVQASEVRLPRPPDKVLPGRWIDADLKEPAMVTAYEGDKVVHSCLAIKGTVADSTPTGTFQIWRRVDNETMDSETLQTPIPRDAAGGYYLKDVLYTQYFTYDGASLHYNYWLGTFGYPGSHGCLGLSLEDAKWLWDWASIGTPVVVR